VQFRLGLWRQTEAHLRVRPDHFPGSYACWRAPSAQRRCLVAAHERTTWDSCVCAVNNPATICSLWHAHPKRRPTPGRQGPVARGCTKKPG
jgi:hypothetical protein